MDEARMDGLFDRTIDAMLKLRELQAYQLQRLKEDSTSQTLQEVHTCFGLTNATMETLFSFLSLRSTLNES